MHKRAIPRTQMQRMALRFLYKIEDMINITTQKHNKRACTNRQPLLSNTTKAPAAIGKFYYQTQQKHLHQWATFTIKHESNNKLLLKIAHLIIKQPYVYNIKTLTSAFNIRSISFMGLRK